jgi:hypothetical protein
VNFQPERDNDNAHVATTDDQREKHALRQTATGIFFCLINEIALQIGNRTVRQHPSAPGSGQHRSQHGESSPLSISKFQYRPAPANGSIP